MSNCKNCAAPIPPETTICPYCGTRNDVDLHRMNVSKEEPESDRICPRCNIKLHSIDLNLEGRFLIERCTSCMGMFFDPGELEAVLDKSVSNVYHIDHKQLEDLNTARRQEQYGVSYIKCPICRKLMHRTNFGTKSGVIIDTCKDHGMWLDGGELRQLMEWMKAGGQLFHQQKQVEYDTMKQQSYQQKQKMTGTMPTVNVNYQSGGARGGSFGDRDIIPDADILGSVFKVASRLFRLI